MLNIKRSMQAIIAVGLSSCVQFGLVNPASAAPLRAPLSSVKLTMADVTFPRTGWTLSPMTNDYALKRFNSLVNSAHDWVVTPTICMPPRDSRSLRIARTAIKNAVIELFTQKKQHKDILVALSADNPDIKEFVPQIKSVLDSCSDVSAHTKALLDIDRSKAYATITPITPPSINGVTESYGYHLSGSHSVPLSTKVTVNPLNTEIGDKALNHEGSGDLYVALVRGVWVIMLEGGTYGNTEELNSTFIKQINKIRHAH